MDMDIDDLRDRIWDYLFQTKAQHSIEEIATLGECDLSTVRTAVDHGWFKVQDGKVSIAYVNAGGQSLR